MIKRVSARDVAKKAGVSRTTVSFVLNNTPGKNISEETRQKVLRAAAELNYRPNELARSLAMHKRHSIGLFICHNQFIFSDAYIIRVVEGMSSVLNRHRFQLVLQSIRLNQSNYMDLARQDKVEGIILLNTHDHDKGLMELITEQFPLVVIGTLSDRSIVQVDIDNLAAAKDVCQHLIRLDHRRIAMIVHAPLVYYAASLRYQGYREALHEAGLSFMEERVRIGNFSEESGYRAMQELLQLDPQPSAIFAGNDTVAFGAIRAIKDAGIDIPGDISIAGFDDDILTRYLNPPLTSMSLPAAGLGGQAAKLLIAMLTRGVLPRDKQLLLPTHLSVRSSCRNIDGDW